MPGGAVREAGGGAWASAGLESIAVVPGDVHIAECAAAAVPPWRTDLERDSRAGRDREVRSDAGDRTPRRAVHHLLELQLRSVRCFNDTTDGRALRECAAGDPGEAGPAPFVAADVVRRRGTRPPGQLQ